MGWADRAADHLQRKSDERAARWRERQQERRSTGKITLEERYVAHAQRKIDERSARWQELEPLRELIRGDVTGPGNSACVISVDQTGGAWISQLNIRPTGTSAGGLVALVVLAAMLITELIWWLVFHRTYTIHAHTLNRPYVTIHVRMANQVDAYHAAAQLATRFRDHGPAALHAWRAEITGTLGR